MMMMTMMTMMTTTTPYRRTKTHIWDKVLMGIWVHPINISTMMINMINMIVILINIDQYNDQQTSSQCNDDQHQPQLDITVARDFATYTALKSNSQV